LCPDSKAGGHDKSRALHFPKVAETTKGKWAHVAKQQ
jgi:hypothetical protein